MKKADFLSTKVYRIIGLEGFMSILINKEERYVRPIDSWPDTFEGYMLHQLDSTEGMRKVIEKLYILSGGNVNATIMSISKLLRSRYACYGQCWSKDPDSDAMWRIYAYNDKAIQLVTTIQKIQDMVIPSAWDQLEIRISEVEYDINNEKDALNKMLVRSARINSAYFHKRPAFKHEQEIRVLLDDSKKYDSLDMFTAAAIRMNMKKVDATESEPEQILEATTLTLGNKEGYKSSTLNDIKLGITDIRDYLDGIRVHPLAPDWYVSLIKNICRNYRVRFLGQSDLYRPVV